MRPTFTKSKNVSISDIEQLENELNIKLPEQYKHFLLECNGGTPEPEFFCTKYVGEHTHSFCDISYVINSTFNCWKEEDLAYRVPKTMIKIAVTSGSEDILLGVGKDSYNKVYILISSGEVSEELDEDEPEIWLVADSFDEFINSFCTEEEYLSSDTKLLDVVYYKVSK